MVLSRTYYEVIVRWFSPYLCTYAYAFFVQRQWLEYLEEVKKKKAAKDKARREAATAVERKQVQEVTELKPASTNRNYPSQQL